MQAVDGVKNGLEQGKDVLIILMTCQHAVAYRTMSLLLKRPREENLSGDVFYLHSDF